MMMMMIILFNKNKNNNYINYQILLILKLIIQI
jgi:hypothetical protein